MKGPEFPGSKRGQGVCTGAGRDGMRPAPQKGEPEDRRDRAEFGLDLPGHRLGCWRVPTAHCLGWGSFAETLISSALRATGAPWWASLCSSTFLRFPPRGIQMLSFPARHDGEKAGECCLPPGSWSKLMTGSDLGPQADDHFILPSQD